MYRVWFDAKLFGLITRFGKTTWNFDGIFVFLILMIDFNH